MEITGQILENYLFERIRSLSLPITGKFYKRGTRPMGSKKEDCVVGFISGNSNQIQEGECVVNIYVNDIMARDGQYYKDFSRCVELEALMVAIPGELNTLGNIRFEKSDIVRTFEERDLNQHYVSLKLKYKHLNS